MALSKGMYNKDDCGRLTSKDSNNTRRSKQNTYHVVNKNIAPSKLPMEVDERGDAFWGIPKLRLLVVLEFYLGCLWNPQSYALATPYSIVHQILTQNLKTSQHKTQQKIS